jgi:hypothetical protein
MGVEGIVSPTANTVTALRRADFAGDVRHAVGVVEVSLGELTSGRSPRLHGLNHEHVVALMDRKEDWPPILITRADRTIIDGQHRFRAAQLLGHSSIACIISDAPETEAFVESIRRNLKNGLPLTRRDRKHAARVVLELHCDWSDRRIAALCAIDHGTVASLRADLDISPTGQNLRLDTRLGRDGKRRPVDYASTRQRVIQAIRAEPQASLRQIAQSAGVSPETVRTVKSRNRAQPVADSASNPLHTPAGVSTTYGSPNGIGECEPEPRGPRAHLQPGPEAQANRTLGWESDPALRSTSQTQAFLEWFGQTSVRDTWPVWVDTVPLSRIYEIADEARRRADAWVSFARALEQRSHPTTANLL